MVEKPNMQRLKRRRVVVQRCSEGEWARELFAIVVPPRQPSEGLETAVRAPDEGEDVDYGQAEGGCFCVIRKCRASELHPGGDVAG